MTENLGATLVLQPRCFPYLLVAFNLSFHVIDDPNTTTAKGLMFALLLTGSFFFETRSGADPKDAVIVPNEAYAHLDRMVGWAAGR
jgi:hypothetical protein